MSKPLTKEEVLAIVTGILENEDMAVTGRLKAAEILLKDLGPSDDAAEDAARELLGGLT